MQKRLDNGGSSSLLRGVYRNFEKNIFFSRFAQFRLLTFLALSVCQVIISESFAQNPGTLPLTSQLSPSLQPTKQISLEAPKDFEPLVFGVIQAWGHRYVAGVHCNAVPIEGDLFLASKSCKFLELAIQKKEKLEIVPTQLTGMFALHGVKVTAIDASGPFFVLTTRNKLLANSVAEQLIPSKYELETFLPGQAKNEIYVLGFPTLVYGDTQLRMESLPILGLPLVPPPLSNLVSKDFVSSWFSAGLKGQAYPSTRKGGIAFFYSGNPRNVKSDVKSIRLLGLARENFVLSDQKEELAKFDGLWNLCTHPKFGRLESLTKLCSDFPKF